MESPQQPQPSDGAAWAPPSGTFAPAPAPAPPPYAPPADQSGSIHPGSSGPIHPGDLGRRDQPDQPEQPANPYASYGPPPHLGRGPAPARGPATNRLPLAALITGVTALTIGNLISIGVLGVVGGAVGIGLAIGGLVRFRRTGTGNEQMAFAGIGVSVLAAGVGVVVLVATLPTLLAGFAEGWEIAQEDWESEPYLADQEPAPPPTHEWEVSGGNRDVLLGPWQDPGVPLDPAGGVRSIGQSLMVRTHEVTVTAIDLDADAAIAAADAGNPAPSGRYVMVSLHVANRSERTSDPAGELMAVVLGADGSFYDETTCSALTPRPAADVDPIVSHGEVEFDVCFDVPPDAVGEPVVLVRNTVGPPWYYRAWADD